MTSKPLREYGVYCVALTPYQYIAKSTGHSELPYTLATPFDWPHKAVPMVVTQEGKLLTSDGTWHGLTVADLDDTGRTWHAGHTFCSTGCQDECV